MALTLPVHIAAEYRGIAREWEGYTHQETGEVRPGGRSLKFEFETPEGHIADLVISQGSVDKAAEFDIGKLKRGEAVELVGVAVDGKSGMYFRPTSITRRAAAVRDAA